MKKKHKTRSWIFSAQGVVFLFVLNLCLILTLGALFSTEIASKGKTQLMGPSVIRDEVVGVGSISAQAEPSFRISAISGQQDSGLSTKVYPGYTMSFDVAVVSLPGAEDPTFIYSILNGQGEEIHHSSEQKNVGGESVFTKKITLPDDLPLGRYKLRIEAIIGDSKTIQEQYFYVEESPMAGFQSNISEKTESLITRVGMVIVFSVFIISLIIFLVVIKHQKHHNKFQFLKN